MRASTKEERAGEHAPDDLDGVAAPERLVSQREYRRRQHHAARGRRGDAAPTRFGVLEKEDGQRPEAGGERRKQSDPRKLELS